jgi:hypothetical protein
MVDGHGLSMRERRRREPHCRLTRPMVDIAISIILSSYHGSAHRSSVHGNHVTRTRAHRTRGVHLRNGRWNVQVNVPVIRFWRIMLEVDDVVLISLEILLTEIVNDGLAILLLLMRAFVSGKQRLAMDYGI